MARGLCERHYKQWWTRHRGNLPPRSPRVPRICEEDGCKQAVLARGMCKKHYSRWRSAKRKGQPRPVTPPLQRFWRNVQVGDNDSCWLWLGPRAGRGYGVMSIRIDPNVWRNVYAHRFAYEHLVAPIPDGLTIDHLCRNRLCVNPDHLEAVTAEENVRRWARSVTHCPRGHAYTPENTYTDSRGCRECRSCRREQQRKRRAARAA